MAFGCRSGVRAGSPASSIAISSLGRLVSADAYAHATAVPAGCARRAAIGLGSAGPHLHPEASLSHFHDVALRLVRLRACRRPLPGHALRGSDLPAVDPRLSPNPYDLRAEEQHALWDVLDVEDVRARDLEAV